MKSLYECKGKDFISTFEKDFPKNSENKFTTSEIIDILDKHCNELVRKWVKDLESKTKN